MSRNKKKLRVWISLNTENGNDIWYNKLKLKVYQKRLFIINFPFSRNACVPRINSTNYENVEKEEIDLSTMLLNLIYVKNLFNMYPKMRKLFSIITEKKLYILFK